MATLVLDCPHCPARSMTFDMVGNHGVWLTDTTVSNTYFLLMRCNGCGKCVACEVFHQKQQTASVLNNCKGDVESTGFRVKNYWPQPAKVDAPEHCPDNIARFYKQAAAALQRGDWDAAGMMARKALDAATFDIDSTLGRGMNLVKRIDKLAGDHKITPQLQEWAHAIRVDGNDAAHDPDEFTEDEAKQICEFARTFLEYVFTMPGKLAARRAKFQPPAATAS